MAAFELLEAAAGYLAASIDRADAGLLSRATPCAGWDLRTLLYHVSDSLGVLCDAIGSGHVCACGYCDPPDLHGPLPGTDVAAGVREGVRRLLRICAGRGGGCQVAVGDRELAVSVVAATGAVELAVHGWDVSVACGDCRPLPPAMAADLVRVAMRVATGPARAGLFAEPVPVPPGASPGDRLVAFLGREPAGPGGRG